VTPGDAFESLYGVRFRRFLDQLEHLSEDGIQGRQEHTSATSKIYVQSAFGDSGGFSDASGGRFGHTVLRHDLQHGVDLSVYASLRGEESSILLLWSAMVQAS
jgi:hypothetical protein